MTDRAADFDSDNEIADWFETLAKAERRIADNERAALRAALEELEKSQ